jgi:hypothetical protein
VFLVAGEPGGKKRTVFVVLVVRPVPEWINFSFFETAVVVFGFPKTSFPTMNVVVVVECERVRAAAGKEPPETLLCDISIIIKLILVVEDGVFVLIEEGSLNEAAFIVAGAPAEMFTVESFSAGGVAANPDRSLLLVPDVCR